MPLLDRELSLALVDTLFEAGPFGVALFDVDGRYVRVSPVIADLNGLPAEEHVGRTPEEVIPHLAPELTKRLRRALAGRLPVAHELAGETLADPHEWHSWFVSYHPVRDGDEVVGVAALGYETTGRRRAEEQRARLLEREREARERAEEAERRAEFLAEAGMLLDTSLDLPTTLRTLARVVVPRLADLCIVDMLCAGGDVRRVAVAHRDPEAERLVWELSREAPSGPDIRVGIRRAMASGEAEVVADVSEDLLAAAFPDPAHRERVRPLGLRAAAIMPLTARERTLGAMTSVRVRERDPFAPEDVALAADLARRAALAIDNARLHTELSRVAETLQHALRPAALPEVPHLEVAARFRAAGDAAAVGGDFYDVWERAPGEWGAVIGDVCGKGAAAAALTGLARHTVRAAAAYEPGPAGVLAALDRAVAEQSAGVQFCTAAHVWLVPGPDRAGLRWALGGHLPPLLVRADGGVEALEASGALLGAWPEPRLAERHGELRPGDALVLLTDGVTEAGAPEDPVGEDAVRALVSALARRPADEIAEAVAELPAGRRARDDVAVLVIALPAR